MFCKKFPCGKVVKSAAIIEDARRVDGEMIFHRAKNSGNTPCCQTKMTALFYKGLNSGAVLRGNTLILVQQRSIQIAIEIVPVVNTHDSSCAQRIYPRCGRRRNWCYSKRPKPDAQSFAAEQEGILQYLDMIFMFRGAIPMIGFVCRAASLA